MIAFFVGTPIAIGLWGAVAWGLHWLWEHRAGRTLPESKIGLLEREAKALQMKGDAEEKISTAKRGY